MNASIWGYFRIITGTLVGGIAGFYFMHRAELKYKEMWQERLRKYEEEMNRRKKIEEANSSNEFPESISLFCWLLLTSSLFILSWLSVMRSTGQSHSVAFGILPNSRLLRFSENSNLDESMGERANWDKNLGKCGASVEKDVIAPYRHVTENYMDDCLILTVA